MLTLSVDLDGVLGNFTRNVIDIANQIWPGRVPLDYEPQNWNYTDIFAKEDWNAIWERIKITPDFWFFELPYAENVKALFQFLFYERKDANVYFITSRAETVGSSATQQSIQWLTRLGLLPMDGRCSVIRVYDAADKAALMKMLRIQYSIDDYGPTVEQCSLVENHTAFLLDRPWNRSYTNLLRVYSMENFIQRIRLVENLGSLT